MIAPYILGSDSCSSVVFTFVRGAHLDIVQTAILNILSALTLCCAGPEDLCLMMDSENKVQCEKRIDEVKQNQGFQWSCLEDLQMNKDSKCYSEPHLAGTDLIALLWSCHLYFHTVDLYSRQYTIEPCRPLPFTLSPHQMMSVLHFSKHQIHKRNQYI